MANWEEWVNSLKENDGIPVNDAGSRSVTIQGDLTSREPTIEGIDQETGFAPIGARGYWKGFDEEKDYNILDIVKEISDPQHFSHTEPRPGFKERHLEETGLGVGNYPGGVVPEDWSKDFHAKYDSLIELMDKYKKGHRGLDNTGLAFRIRLRQDALRNMITQALGETQFEGGSNYDISTEIGERIKKLIPKK